MLSSLLRNFLFCHFCCLNCCQLQFLETLKNRVRQVMLCKSFSNKIRYVVNLWAIYIRENSTIWILSLPSHLVTTHLLISSLSPEHGVPSVPTMHDLFLLCIPSPHTSEQLDHFSHGDHSIWRNFNFALNIENTVLLLQTTYSMVYICVYYSLSPPNQYLCNYDQTGKIWFVFLFLCRKLRCKLTTLTSPNILIITMR